MSFNSFTDNKVMNYNEEEKEDRKYKKGYSRKEFQKDVAEAVEPVVKGKMGKTKMKATKKKAMGKKYNKSSYAKMSTKELRKLLTDKKKALLKKSGFPESGLPRSKEEMINLCIKLKRKRW